MTVVSSRMSAPGPKMQQRTEVAKIRLKAAVHTFDEIRLGDAVSTSSGHNSISSLSSSPSLQDALVLEQAQHGRDIAHRALAAQPHAIDRLCNLFRAALDRANCSALSSHDFALISNASKTRLKLDPASVREAKSLSSKHLFTLAEQGSLEAKMELADRYEKGCAPKSAPSAFELPGSLTKAAAYYRQAAHADLAEAQEQYGRLCETGRGVDHSVAQAHNWYSRAAEHGLASAQLALQRIDAKTSQIMLSTGSAPLDRYDYIFRSTARVGSN